MAEVLIKKEKFYYQVKLNRPEKHNALTPKMIRELTEFFKTVSKDKFAGAIVLTGAGPSFCSGGDLAWMKSTADFKMKENLADANELFEMFEAAANCPLPIVGYVQGSVFGGGLGLVAICDIAIAEVSTKFCFSEVRLGLVPAVISSFVLRKMAFHKAKELMITAQIFNADTALQAGLVEYVGRELEAKEYMQQTLDAISKNGPQAVRVVKGLVSGLEFLNKKEIKEQCVKIISERRVSDEGQEGMRSFLEKRKPAWVWNPPDDKDE